MSSISNNRPNLPINGYNAPVAKPTKQSSQGDNPLTPANPGSEASTLNTNPTKANQAPTRFDFAPQTLKQSTQGDSPLSPANPGSEASTLNTNPTKSFQAPTRFDFDPQTLKQSTQGDSPLSAADSSSQLRTIIANSKQAAEKELTPEAKARVAAEGLVSTTFIEPILKQIRESNTAPPPFGPSNAEKQFASLLDTTLADEIVHASNFPIVDRIASQLLKNMPQVQPEKNLDIEG